MFLGVEWGVGRGGAWGVDCSFLETDAMAWHMERFPLHYTATD